jgi:hypothetical protein
MKTLPCGTVHTITDWYDGARAGIADFNGLPHYYQCEQEYGPAEDYLLTPLDEETFQLAMEDWAIWLRWSAARDKGQATLETHPALPEDRARHDFIASILVNKLTSSTTLTFKVKAKFLYGESLVEWQSPTGASLA